MMIAINRVFPILICLIRLIRIRLEPVKHDQKFFQAFQKSPTYIYVANWLKLWTHNQ